MDWYQIFQVILDNLAVPILIAIGGGLTVIATKWTDKIGNSITIKNEIESIEKRMKARKDILDTLRPTVEAAVATNMQLADKLRQQNGKLSEEDAVELNRSAQELVMSTLPNSLTDDDGILLDIIGGKSQLEAAIKVMIEQYVYEYKLKNVNVNNSNGGVIYPNELKSNSGNKTTVGRFF